MKADIVVSLQYGDEGKGKVTHHLLKRKTLLRKPKYTHCLRFNGGPNAGHTIYHNGEKFVTHQIPAGVFYGITSVIGPECTVDPRKLVKELQFLFNNGLVPFQSLKIDYRAHIITPEHISEESNELAIGTTRSGIGPAYRDKYIRTGLRAESITDLRPYLIDIYEELNRDSVYVLCEGAQGYGLDITWGDYPFVTSSHCTVAGALLNGIPYTAVKHVYGVAKCYETYVGAKQFQDNDDPMLAEIARVGNEFGATTGRPRQVNYLSLDNIYQAATINSVDTLIINKMDVLRRIDKDKTLSSSSPWKMRLTERKPLTPVSAQKTWQLADVEKEKEFKRIIKLHVPKNTKIIFSDSPEGI